MTYVPLSPSSPSPLLFQLASMDDSSLSRLLLPLSHRLLSSSVDLDDFSSNESTKAEQMDGEAAQHAIRYSLAHPFYFIPWDQIQFFSRPSNVAFFVKFETKTVNCGAISHNIHYILSPFLSLDNS